MSARVSVWVQNSEQTIIGTLPLLLSNKYIFLEKKKKVMFWSSIGSTQSYDEILLVKV